MKAEEWKAVSKRVEVSTHGRIKKDGKIIEPSARGGNGYMRVSIGGIKERYVHRLVLAAFKPKPEGKNFVNHINGNKLDNRLINLEWSTNRENLLLASKKGRFSNGSHRKIPVKVIHPDGTVKIYESQSEASRAIGADKKGTCVNRALHGQRKTTHGVRIEYA